LDPLYQKLEERYQTLNEVSLVLSSSCTTSGITCFQQLKTKQRNVPHLWEYTYILLLNITGACFIPFLDQSICNIH
jgi:hypothetical protein